MEHALGLAVLTNALAVGMLPTFAGLGWVPEYFSQIGYSIMWKNRSFQGVKHLELHSMKRDEKPGYTLNAQLSGFNDAQRFECSANLFVVALTSSVSLGSCHSLFLSCLTQ